MTLTLPHWSQDDIHMFASLKVFAEKTDGSIWRATFCFRVAFLLL
jgi:hypothetical protein